MKFREGYFSSQVDVFPMFSGKQRLTRLAQNCKYVELYEDLSQFFLPTKAWANYLAEPQIFCEAGHSWESIFPCHLSWRSRKILRIYRVWFHMLKQCPSLLVLRHERFAVRRKIETGQRFTRGSASNWWSTFQMGALSRDKIFPISLNRPCLHPLMMIKKPLRSESSHLQHYFMTWLNLWAVYMTGTSDKSWKRWAI